jgi:magnesium-transporting ATPase (P-type)
MESLSFNVNEAILTGETNEVEKHCGALGSDSDLMLTKSN